MAVYNPAFVDLSQDNPITPPTINSVWTTKLSDYTSLELDPNNDAVVASFVAHARDPVRTAWLLAGKSGTPFIEVPADQPRVDVEVINGTQPFYSALQTAFHDSGGVPIPLGAPTTNTSDSAMTLYQESTDSYWELWVAKPQLDGSWTCKYGGVTKQYRENTGSFGPDDIPGLSLYRWGTSATSILIAPGLTRVAEMAQGYIPHAITVWTSDVRQDMWAWPAQRSDGSLLDPNEVPYGAHFFLDPAFDVSTIQTYASRVFAKAMQDYGFIVRDRTHFSVSIDCEYDTVANWNQALQAPANNGAFWGTIMAHIPWESMKLLKMDLRNHTGPPSP